MLKDKLRVLHAFLGILIYFAFRNGSFFLGAVLLIADGLLGVFLGHGRLAKLAGVACVLFGLYMLLLLLGVLFLAWLPIPLLN